MKKSKGEKKENPSINSETKKVTLKKKGVIKKLLHMAFWPYRIYEKVVRWGYSKMPQVITKPLAKLPSKKLLVKISFVVVHLVGLVVVIAGIVIGVAYMFKNSNLDLNYKPSVNSASFFNHQQDIKPDDFLVIDFVNSPDILELESYLEETYQADFVVEEVKDKSLKIVRKDGWDTDQTYDIILPSTSLSFIDTTFELNFSTIKSPHVVLTNIDSFSDPTAPILVTFNSEVLNSKDFNKDSAFELVPTGIKEVEVLSPSTVRITPVKELGNIEHTLKIKGDAVTNQYGLNMVGDYEKTFTPGTINSSESYGQSFVSRVIGDVNPDTYDSLILIAVENIDRQSLLENAKLTRDGGGEVDYTVSWQNQTVAQLKAKYGFTQYYYDKSDKMYSVAFIKPKQPWQKKTNYTITVNDTLKDINGELMRNRFQRSIYVPGDFEFVSSSESGGVFDGKSSSYYSNTFQLTFSNGIFASKLELDNLVTVEALTGLPGEMDAYVYMYWEGTTVNVDADFRDGQSYKVTVSPELMDKYGNKLGKEQVIEFEARNVSPPALVNIYGPRVSFIDSSADYKILFESMNVQDVHVELAKVLPEEFHKIRGEDYDQIKNSRAYQLGQVVRTWDKHFDNFDNPQIKYGLLQFQYPLENVESGVYVLRASSKDGSYRDHRLLMFSEYGAVIKKGEHGVLVWASKLSDGTPLVGKELQIGYTYKDRGTGSQKSTTNADGVAQISTDNKKIYGAYAYSADGVVYVDSDFDRNMYNLNYSGGYKQDYDEKITYAYFDRQVYKAGQEVNFKIFTRERNSNVLNVNKESLNVTVYSPQREVIYSGKLDVGEFGTAYGSITLEENYPSGLYEMKLEDHYDLIGGFRVSAYQPQNFTYSVEDSSSELLAIGDTVQLGINADYYFGDPLVGAEVEVTTYIRDDSSDDYDDNGKIVSKETHKILTKTDKNGEAEVNVPVVVPENLSYGGSKTLSIEVKVTDEVGSEQYKTLYKTISPKGGTISTTSGDYSVNILDNQIVTISGVIKNERGVARSATEVVVNTYRVDTSEVKRRRDNGVYFWENVTNDVLVETKSLVSSKNGTFEYVHKPEVTGSYKSVFSWVANANVQTTRGFYAYDYGSFYYNHLSDAAVELNSEKDSYTPGERVTVAPEFEGNNLIALYTTERYGIMDYQVIDYRAGENFEMQVTKEHAPNYYVTMVGYSPHTEESRFIDVKFGSTEVEIDYENRSFDSSITTDREEYSPGDQVKVNIDGSTNQEVEYMVAVVDKAVLDLAKLDNREKLQEELVDAFWKSWSKKVRTATTLSLYENKHNAKKQWGNKGGSGDGGDAGESLEIEDIRRDFKPLALWIPADISKDGDYEVTFDVPDNLTTWSVISIGITKDSKFSVATKEVRVANDVNIIAGLPEYLYSGDSSTIVYNATFRNSEEDDMFDVRLELDNATVLCGGKEADTCTTSKTAGAFPVEYSIRPSVDSGIVKIRFGIVKDGQTQDAVEREVEILPNIQSNVRSLYGDTYTNQSNNFFFPTGSTNRKVKISLSDSVLGDKENFKQYFISYRNKCSEQTASTIQGLLPFSDDPEASQKINEGIDRLYYLQNSDGGWGIWKYSNSTPYTSLHAYQTLYFLSRSGYDIDKSVIDNASNYILGKLSSDWRNGDDVVMALSILADTGYFDIARTNNYYNTNVEGISTVEATYLLNTYVEYLDSDEIGELEKFEITKRVDSLHSLIINNARVADGKVYWQDDRYQTGWHYYRNDLKTTALILDTFMDMKGDDPSLVPVINYLKYEIATNHQSLGTQANLYIFLSLDRATDVYNIGITGTLPVIKVNGMIRPLLNIGGGDSSIDIDLNDNDQDLDVEVTTISNSLVFYQVDISYDLPFSEIVGQDDRLAIYTEYLDLEGNKVPVNNNGQVIFDQGQTYKARTLLFVPDNIAQSEIRIATPAGMRAIDFNLNSTSDELYKSLIGDNKNHRFFSNLSINSQDVVFYTGDMTYDTQMKRGVYDFTYYTRATYKGEYEAPGEFMQEMYLPGRGAWQTPVRVVVE